MSDEDKALIRKVCGGYLADLDRAPRNLFPRG